MAQEMQAFLCTVCGACCRHIAGIAELAGFDLGNGICKYLDETSNTCAIYGNRPQICRIDAMYAAKFAGSYTREAFYALNLEACRILQQRK